MADELDVLIDKVDDPALRSELRAQVDRLRSRRTFGLVFEDHLPERVRLPDHPIRRGIRGTRRDQPDAAVFDVVKVRGGVATVTDREGETSEVPVADLVVVAEFGHRIHPGLQRLGSIDRGGDKPAHVVINAENHHALEMLQFTHAGKVDCIYIDPPYNTGARDWKYDNDYVDGDDAYRHSKWLAFMQRRLKLAKKLLNPENSVLIVTIDEREVNRLGLLLDRLFVGAVTQMVSVLISAKGTMRRRGFSRVNEYVFFVLVGEAAVQPSPTNMLTGKVSSASRADVTWLQLRRREPTSVRSTRPNQFFPIFVRRGDGSLHSIGDSLPAGVSRDTVVPPDGTAAHWPLNSRGHEMVWGLTPETLRRRRADGHFRVRNWNPSRGTASFQYLPGGVVDGIRSGRIEVAGRDSDGSVQARTFAVRSTLTPPTIWSLESHNAETQGTNLVRALIDRRFPFPKSLYAVEDAIRFFVADKPDAVVLDFFAGSGTTAHAVARLNRQDGGRRQSILVTNNEVSVDEAKTLTAAGHRDATRSGRRSASSSTSPGPASRPPSPAARRRVTR